MAIPIATIAMSDYIQMKRTPGKRILDRSDNKGVSLIGEVVLVDCACNEWTYITVGTIVLS